MTTPVHRQYIITNEIVDTIVAVMKGFDLPVTAEKMGELLRTCPYPSDQEVRYIEQLKKAIVEVLDTGFESSERDMILVLDRIDTWEKGIPYFARLCGCASHSSVQSRDQVLDEAIACIRSKVSLPTNSGEQISCDASIRLSIIHDLKELRQQSQQEAQR